MRRSTLPAGLLAALLLGGCAGGGTTAARVSPTSQPPSQPTRQSTSPTDPRPAPAATPTPTSRPPLGTVPPSWLGTRPLDVDADGIGLARPTPKILRDRSFTLPDRLPMLPGSGFAAVVRPVPVGVLARSTWQPSCPVALGELRWVRLTFWGFDDARHTGELLVNAAVADDVVAVFRSLYAARFPIEEMRIASRADLDAAPTGDGNDTGSFACRPAVGQTAWSQHAYGLAVDVDPFQNPYVDGSRVIPELASAYVDRADRRPGMIEPGDVVVRAFERIGWTWGGTWSSTLDLQHFSANGR